MLKITPTSKFKKDLKKFKHNVRVLQEVHTILTLLVGEKPLPKNVLDHSLSGNWKGSRECHINPDVLLIYRIEKQSQILFLERLGSHAELF